MATAERQGVDPPALLLQGAVPQQLARTLRGLRREGLRFEAAWEEALLRITWPTSSRETIEWGKALASTQHSWRAAYEGWDSEASENAVRDLHRLRLT